MSDQKAIGTAKIHIEKIGPHMASVDAHGTLKDIVFALCMATAGILKQVEDAGTPKHLLVPMATNIIEECLNAPDEKRGTIIDFSPHKAGGSRS